MKRLSSRARTIVVRPGVWLTTAFSVDGHIEPTEVKSEIEGFLASHPDGKLISFDYDLFHAGIDWRMRYWREELLLVNELALCAHGYDTIDAFLAGLAPEARLDYELIYHDLGADSFLAAALTDSLENAEGPFMVFIVLPAALTSLHRAVEKLWFDHPIDDTGTVSALRRNQDSRSGFLNRVLAWWVRKPLFQLQLQWHDILHFAQRSLWRLVRKIARRQQKQHGKFKRPSWLSPPRKPFKSPLRVFFRWYARQDGQKELFLKRKIRGFLKRLLRSFFRWFAKPARKATRKPRFIWLSYRPHLLQQWRAYISRSNVQHDWLANIEAIDLLVVVEDPGFNLFLGPAMPVIEELMARGFRLLVLSSSDFVVEHTRQIGCPALLFQPSISERLLQILQRDRSREKLFAWAFGPGRTLYRGLLSCIFFHRGIVLNQWRRHSATRIEEIFDRLGPKAVFSVPEPVRLPILVGRIAEARSLPWFGYLNLLIGDHPESRFWPAGRHLVYGAQAADRMKKAGCTDASIQIVGSVNFDKTVQHDSTHDHTIVEKLIPNRGQRPIVVIATEQRAQQIEDISAILAALRADKQLCLVIKVHPADSIAAFERLAEAVAPEANVAIIGSCNLDALLSEASLLICQRSNIIITAAILGTPTLVCDFTTTPRILDFAREGIAAECTNPADIATLTHKYIFDPAERAALLARTADNLHRFNGPCDGKTVPRIANILQHAIEQTSGRLPRGVRPAEVEGL
jgi:hypothetical protein